MYKAEKAVGKYLIYTSSPPLLLGLLLSGTGGYLRRRRKNDIEQN
ncbi:MAG: LPXTG cell wall anchor domain-containing protein [Nanoarchaeota archaeon]